jgi:hypothetical protein
MAVLLGVTHSAPLCSNSGFVSVGDFLANVLEVPRSMYFEGYMQLVSEYADTHTYLHLRDSCERCQGGAHVYTACVRAQTYLRRRRCASARWWSCAWWWACSTRRTSSSVRTYTTGPPTTAHKADHVLPSPPLEGHL